VDPECEFKSTPVVRRRGGLTTTGNRPAREEKVMNALTKWNPFRELEEMQNRLSSLFGRTPLRGLGRRR
jgi:hypothetical protein